MMFVFVIKLNYCIMNAKWGVKCYDLLFKKMSFIELRRKIYVHSSNCNSQYTIKSGVYEFHS